MRRKAKRKLGRRRGQGPQRRPGFAQRQDRGQGDFKERFADRRAELQGDRPESPGDGTILESIRARMKERMGQDRLGTGDQFQGNQQGRGDGSLLPDQIKDRFQDSGPYRPDAQPPVTREQFQAQQLPQHPPAQPYQPQPALQPGQPISSGMQPAVSDGMQQIAPVSDGQQQIQPAPQPQPAPVQAQLPVEEPQPSFQPGYSPQPAPVPVQAQIPGGYQPPQGPAAGVAQQVMQARRKMRLRPDGSIDDGSQLPQ
jgi:hypothetical protein